MPNTVVLGHSARRDWGLARRAQRHSIRLIEILGGGGYLGSLKAVLEQEGIQVGSVRLPLRAPSQVQTQDLLAGWEAWSAEAAEIVAA
jgi:dihydrodipicolinate synthase/N-acetylneuraminate lyase